VRLYYASQTRVRPPTFAFFSNTPEGVGPAYRRYLANRLREQFGFEGTPLRLQVRRRRRADEEKEDAPE
jgi:GTP-binding protein